MNVKRLTSDDGLVKTGAATLDRCPLASDPTPIKPTTAYPGNHAVRLAGDTRCPRCGRERRATDVDIHRGEIWLRCRNCHSDILTVERK